MSSEKTPSPHSQIEKQANFQGNETLLMLKRIRNKKILNQLITLIKEAETAKRSLFLSNEPKTVLPGNEGLPEFVTFGDNPTWYSAEHVRNILSVPARTEEEIESEIQSVIEEVESSTRISFENKVPDLDIIHVNWHPAWSTEKATNKQLSIVEAHEKGHVIRDYTHLTGRLNIFKDAFDTENLVISEEYKKILDTGLDGIDKEYLEDQIISYLFNDKEIAERMAQLKNYFGFDGDQEFTKEHLDYARQHYIKDTGVDNDLELFFSAITPEVTERFLYYINNSGI